MHANRILFLETIKILTENGLDKSVWGDQSLSSENSSWLDLNSAMFLAIAKKDLYGRGSYFKDLIISGISPSDIDIQLYNKTHLDRWQIKILRFMNGFRGDHKTVLNSAWPSFEWPKKIELAWAKFSQSTRDYQTYEWYKHILGKMANYGGLPTNIDSFFD